VGQQKFALHSFLLFDRHLQVQVCKVPTNFPCVQAVRATEQRTGTLRRRRALISSSQQHQPATATARRVPLNCLRVHGPTQARSRRTNHRHPGLCVIFHAVYGHATCCIPSCGGAKLLDWHFAHISVSGVARPIQERRRGVRSLLPCSVT